MSIKIWPDESWQRFDRFLRKYFKKQSEVKLWDIYLWIRKWVIKVNWKKCTEEYRISQWDVIDFDSEKIVDNIPIESIMTKDEKQIALKLEDIKKFILYEDNNWIVWDKPAWVVVHPWNKHTEDLTFNEYLYQYIKFTNPNLLNSDTFTPSFCFRLDKDTTWILIAAKNYEALKYLNKLIRDRNTTKEYVAIVKWKFIWSKTIDLPLTRSYNKEFGKAQTIIDKINWDSAITKCDIMKYVRDDYLWDISMVHIKLMTWRMHQIRAHLTYIGYPIIWDLMYWDPVINRIANKKHKILRQLLHSWKYWFYDIFTSKKISIESNIPTIFKNLV